MNPAANIAVSVNRASQEISKARIRHIEPINRQGFPWGQTNVEQSIIKGPAPDLNAMGPLAGPVIFPGYTSAQSDSLTDLNQMIFISCNIDVSAINAETSVGCN